MRDAVCTSQEIKAGYINRISFIQRLVDTFRELQWDHMAGLPFTKAMLTLPRHITFTHVSTNSTFFASFYKAAVQYQSALSFLRCWKSWDLTLIGKAGTKALPLDLYFPDCNFQVPEEQELGYFFQNFLLVFIVVFGQIYKWVHDTQRAASFPHVRIPLPTPKCYKHNSLLRSILSALSELQDEHRPPFGYISKGQEMPLSHRVP